VDLSKLTTGDKVLGIGAIVYLISMFLTWYGVDTPFGDYSDSGWSYFLGGILPLLLILAVFAVAVAIPQFAPDTKLPELPVPWSQAVLGGAAAAAVIVLLRVLIGASISGFDLDRKYGVFVAFLAAAAVAVGAFLKYQGKELGSAGGSTGTTPPQAF
jgi:uncharacterized BrkB/YihY/UPF0761 family membrane protein